MYPSDVGSYCNSTVYDGSHPTWAHRLTDGGYHCWATGKFDLNSDFPTGFHEVETRNGHYDNPDITSLFRNPLCYRMDERPDVDGRPRDERHHDEQLTQHTLDFLDGGASSLDKPWACWLGMSQPHPRFVALREYYEMYPFEDIDMPDVRQDDLEGMHLVYQAMRHYKRIATPIPEDRVRRARAGYYGMITELDEYVGRVYSKLEETGQLENTIFIYTSDHGESLGEHGLWHKTTLYENASHVPLVMAGPGIPEGHVVETPVAHVDLVAALFDWAGLDVPSELRGHSLVPLLRGETGDHPGWTYTEAHSEGMMTGAFMIRKGPWKYTHFEWHDGLLFNLDEDPGEFVNRIDDPTCAHVLQDLRGILDTQVDTERATRDAFDAQAKMLQRLTEGKTEAEFAAILESRLGPGQSHLMAATHTPNGR
jgi:choline-sulfatase